MDDGRDLTAGDPLAGAPPPAARGYGAGPVPPGAYAPRRERPPAPAREELAGFGQRAAALALDALIVGGLAAGVLALLGAGLVGGGRSGVLDVVLALLAFVVLFVAFALLYAPLVMARTNGQTLGKRIARCRVVRTDGRRVDVWWAAYREVVVKGVVLGVAGSLTAGIAYLVDFGWPLWDGQRRAVHDLIVDSRVVRTSPVARRPAD